MAQGLDMLLRVEAKPHPVLSIYEDTMVKQNNDDEWVFCDAEGIAGLLVCLLQIGYFIFIGIRYFS